MAQHTKESAERVVLSQVPPSPMQTQLPLTSVGQQFSPHPNLGTKLSQLLSGGLLHRNLGEMGSSREIREMVQSRNHNVTPGRASPQQIREPQDQLPQLSALGWVSEYTHRHFPPT